MTVLDSEFGTAVLQKEGKAKEGTYLLVCTCITAFSTLPYLLLARRFPWPDKRDPPPTEEEKEASAAYEKTGDTMWLTSKQKRFLRRKRLEQGLKAGFPPEPFGEIGADIQHFDRILRMASVDIEYNVKVMIPEAMEQWKKHPEESRKVWKKVALDFQWDEHAEKEVGLWFVKWLEYAGYGNPARDARYWKAIIMILFPILDKRGIVGAFEHDPVNFMVKIARWQKGILGVMSHQEKMERECFTRNCQMFRMLTG